MDIQFVLDVYACARYIAAYVTKSQRGMSELMRKASEEAKRETGNDLKKQFRIIANKFINSVEISAQEATYLLLQLPLKRSSRQVFFLNTSPPKDRIFLLKPQHVIDSLQDEDPDIKVDSIVDKYEARPQNLENVSFAEFASNYEEIKQPIYSRSKWKNASDGLLHEHFDAVDNADDTDDAVDSAAAVAAFSFSIGWQGVHAWSPVQSWGLPPPSSSTNFLSLFSCLNLAARIFRHMSGCVVSISMDTSPSNVLALLSSS